MDRPVVLCDVDGVVADLLTEWLGRYNVRWGDDLTKEDILAWDLAKFVRPECGNQVFDILWEEDLYDYVSPIEGALEGIHEFREMGCRVVYVTSSNEITAKSKMVWLDLNGFLDKSLPPVSQGLDVVIAHDKSLVSGEIMVDDHVGNLLTTQARLPILFAQPHNEIFADDGWCRLDGWEEVVTGIAEWVG